MKIEIMDESPRKMAFILRESNAAFANTLRRTMVNEVPTMAVDFVEFEKNSTGLYDEVISHRLGMVPLTFNQKVYKKKDECGCKGKGCAKCHAVLSFDSLKMKATPIEEYITVKSGDLRSDDDEVVPVSNEIPIVEMLPEHELKFDAVASLGTGKEHAKWQAANVGYSMLPSVKISQDKCKACAKCVESCPKGVFEKKDGKVHVKHADRCILCMRCTEVCQENAVNVKADETSFMFSVESVSGLKPRQILEKALDIIEDNVKKLQKEMK